MDIKNLPVLAQKSEASTQSFFKSLKKSKMRELDDITHILHEEVFDDTDCLSCGNCCRTLGPRITDKDIDRIAKRLRIKAADVVDNYLKVDEDKDYVFKNMPCPFLGADNFCFIYEDRPKACREYPHTDRKKIYQIYKLTIRNSYTCPAVYNVLERLKKEFK